MSGQQAVERPRALLIWIGAVLVVAAALRFGRIGAGGLWIDEAYSLWFARQSYHDLWTVIPSYEFHPPVYYSILRAWRVFGESEAALRSFSALVSLGAVALTTLAVLELLRGKAGGRATALVAGGLLAIAPLQIFHAQDARPYAALVFSVSLLLFAGARLIAAGERARAPFWKAPGLWLLVAAGLGLPPWMHYMGAAPCLAFGLFLLASWILDHRADRWFLINAVAAGGLALLVFVPQLGVMLDRSADLAVATWVQRPSWWWVLRDLQMLYAVDTPYLPNWAGRVLLGLFVTTAAAGAARLWLMERRSAAVLLVALAAVPPILILGLSMVATPMFILRVVTPSQLAVSPLVAVALMGLPRPAWRMAAGALILALTLPAALLENGREKEPWREIAAQLEKEISPGDFVVVAPNEALLPLEYYFKPPPGVDPPLAVPAPFPAIGLHAPYPSGNIATPGITEGFADAALRRVDGYPGRVFYISRTLSLFDPDAFLERALARRRPVTSVTNYWNVRVVTYGSRRDEAGDP